MIKKTVIQKNDQICKYQKSNVNIKSSTNIKLQHHEIMTDLITFL